MIATVSRTEQCTVGSRLGTYIYIRLQLQGVAMAAPVPTRGVVVAVAVYGGSSKQK